MARLDGSKVSAHCAFSSEATVSNSCPSSEWQVIDTYLRLTTNSIPGRDSDGTLIAPTSIQFTGNNSLRQFEQENFGAADPLAINNVDGVETIYISICTTQQSVVADALAIVGAIWEAAIPAAQLSSNGVSPWNHQAAVHTIKADYYQPYSTANCVRDLITGEDDARPISFPVTAPFAYDPVPSNLANTTHYIGGVPVIDYPAASRADFLRSGDSLDYRIGWVDLSPSFFNVSSLGAVILLPDAYTNEYAHAAQNSSKDIVVCTLGAGWGPSSISTTATFESLSATSSLVNIPSLNGIVAPAGVKSTLPGPEVNNYQSTTDIALIYFPPVFPTATIEITEGWAQYLNPQIPSLNTTVIDYMLKYNAGNATVESPEVLIQYVLTALLTNGLARVGGDYQFQGDPKLQPGPNGTSDLDGTFWLSGKGDFFTVDPQESKDWIKLRVDSTIEGFAYNTNGAGPKAAMAVLLTYCALAFAYTLYSGVSGSSTRKAHIA